MELDENSVMLVKNEQEKIWQIFHELGVRWGVDVRYNIAVAIYLKRGLDIRLIDDRS